MICEEVKQFLPGYIDDELELSLAMRIESHLEECTDCRTALEAARLVKRAAKQQALYFPASDAFRNQLSKSLQGLRAEVESPRRHSTPWFTYAGLAAAALVLLACSIWIFSAKQEPRLQVAALLDSHLRSLQTNHLMDVESTDQHTVKPWFAGKLNFSPPVIDLSAEGFPLVGGRVDYLNEQKVAALIYHRNKHIINLYISPGDTTPAADSKDGFNLIRFACNGMSCWAISDVNAGDLQHFADLFKLQKPASTRS